MRVPLAERRAPVDLIGKDASEAIKNLCDKAAACIDPTEIKGLIVTANQTAANAQAITGKVYQWLTALEGAFRK